MTARETWALVPVKRFSQAKSRLGDILLASERATLARAMLCDVLSNLRDTRALAGVAVVSSDPEAFAIAKSLGAATIFDASDHGINPAVQLGLDFMQPYKRQILVVPADIPFARPSDFEHVVELLDHTAVAIVPASLDGGTNALAARTADLLDPRYGENSFAVHRDLARDRKLSCSVFRSDRIGMDIDRPNDIRPCLKSAGAASGLTATFLERLNIERRCESASLTLG